jgi:serine/threonine protein kinase
MAGMRIGKFTVVGTLGTGAHSSILHITREEDGRHYALKVVNIDSADDKKFLDQAQHEFRVAQMLEHPNLIKIFALETSGWLRIKKVQLLIEYVNGKTLDRLKSLNMKALLAIFVKAASGLVHMHRRGVIHADLKPNNIMLSRTGEVKIIDYGLAWIKGEPKGRIQGTPEYIAPETARNGFVNERTEIFNFGATMYRMVTWRLPPALISEGGSVPVSSEVYGKLLKPVLECNPLAPPELGELIHKCLEYNPNNRPERISEVQGALDRLADDHGCVDDDLIDLVA